MVIYMYIATGQGQTTPWAQNIFLNINLLSICSFLASFLPFNYIFLFFSDSNAEWILGFCKDGPTPPSHSQKGANVESSRAPYQSAFSQEDLHEWSPLVFNQCSAVFYSYRLPKSSRSQIDSIKHEYVHFNISSHLGVSHNKVQSLLTVCCSESALFSLDFLLGHFVILFPFSL